jgi:hypothetical protein
MLIPDVVWQGFPNQQTYYSELTDLPNNVLMISFLRSPSGQGVVLPDGYDWYILSWHLEQIDYEWIDQQEKNIILLFDGEFENYPFKKNITPIRYISWHKQLEKINEWHGFKNKYSSDYKNKFSCVCSRITQSKLIVFTAIAEYHDLNDNLLILSDWLEEKNVHHWQKCNNSTLDNLTEIFQNKYYGKSFKVDDYTQNKNYQHFTSNPWQKLCQDAVLNFTNESYHYSYMVDHKGSYVRPGPFITEKTLKCLAAGQAFIPVGQYKTYRSLTDLGFNFDYEFSTSWDLDSGNLSRLESIVNLVKSFKNYSIQDLIDATKHSTIHNIEHLNTGDFSKACNKINSASAEAIYKLVK